MSAASTTCPTRADLVRALADMIEADTRLAVSLAAHIAWDFGYLSGVLTGAEILAAVAADNALAYDDAPIGIDECARHAVREALGNANPTSTTDRLPRPPTARTLAQLSELLMALAQFFESATDLERRGLRRAPPAV